MLLLVTGLPSPGKTRLVDALASRLPGSNIIVGCLPGATPSTVLLHVHAETDVDGLVEGAWCDGAAARDAALVVRVDWEPVEQSVARVIQTLAAHQAGGGGL
jgi:MoxR-like ATPase